MRSGNQQRDRQSKTARETETETKRQRDRDRDKDRESERQRDRETEKERMREGEREREEGRKTDRAGDFWNRGFQFCRTINLGTSLVSCKKHLQYKFTVHLRLDVYHEEPNVIRKELLGVWRARIS